MIDYPTVAEPTFLTYLECPCGRWCAIGEGGLKPRCAACGEWYEPGGGPLGMFGPRDDPQYGRRTRSLNFAAVLMSERAAVRAVTWWRGMLWGGASPSFRVARRERYFSQDEQQRLVVRHGRDHHARGTPRADVDA